jgi:hypothetical protein
MLNFFLNEEIPFDPWLRGLTVIASASEPWVRMPPEIFLLFGFFLNIQRRRITWN